MSKKQCVKCIFWTEYSSYEPDMCMEPSRESSDPEIKDDCKMFLLKKVEVDNAD